MQAVEQQFEAINQLTCSIVKLLESDDFEKVNGLLEKRLTFLKQLDEVIQLSPTKETLLPTYQLFLQKIQQQDNIQLELLLKEKSKLMAESLKQKKTKSAISAYNSVKLG